MDIWAISRVGAVEAGSGVVMSEWVEIGGIAGLVVIAFLLVRVIVVLQDCCTELIADRERLLDIHDDSRSRLAEVNGRLYEIQNDIPANVRYLEDWFRTEAVTKEDLEPSTHLLVYIRDRLETWDRFIRQDRDTP